MSIQIKNYLILDKISQGGFGSIYRALHNLPISQRVAVIKTIKNDLSEKNDFKELFISETKTAFPLSHSNIAQIYEYGESNNQLYYILEYIHGINIKELNEKYQIKGEFPIPFIIYIIMEACKGLHYAHSFKNKFTGKKIQIIHRDISPKNIMIDFNGNVKLIDFGIAKCKTNIDHNKSTVLKGRPSYMSPEYVQSENYDHRVDQFSLGVIFWELLTQKNLFSGDSHLDVIKQVIKCEIPLPRFHNEKVDPELQEIVLKMLRKKFRERFTNSEILYNTLNKYLYKTYPDFSPSYFAKQIRNMFIGKIKRDENQLKKIIEKVKKLS
jgi:eukaryotic-like serine/threonine-protein kinase